MIETVRDGNNIGILFLFHFMIVLLLLYSITEKIFGFFSDKKYLVLVTINEVPLEIIRFYHRLFLDQ